MKERRRHNRTGPLGCEVKDKIENACSALTLAVPVIAIGKVWIVSFVWKKFRIFRSFIFTY